MCYMYDHGDIIGCRHFMSGQDTGKVAQHAFQHAPGL